jgi:cytochrome P450
MSDLKHFYDSVQVSSGMTSGRIGYIVTGYRESRKILADPTFTPPTLQMRLPTALATLYDRLVNEGPANPFEYPSMVVLDGAEHQRVRAKVAAELSPKAARAMADLIGATVDDELDAMSARESNDLLQDYARAVPVRVAASLLGVDENTIGFLRDLGDQAVKMLEIGRPFAEFRELDHCIAQLDEWVQSELARIRCGHARPKGIIGKLAFDYTARDPLTDRELRALISLLVLAGFETTVNLIGSGAVLLLQNPCQLEKLRQDPTLWPNAIEEMLRIDGPVIGTVRMSKQDTWIHSKSVPAKSFVLVSGGNYDSRVFYDPYSFDVTRPNAKDHLTFGGGRHFCIGAHLARLEGQIALSHLFDKYPCLAPDGTFVRRSSVFSRGWKSLPVTLNAPSDTKH